eukprot:TRINITY_DN5306_c0_g1_i1.p1 TRINITY_DN5306_c0_g1~~TRINITY_DN5306_c0_g1_i1.p1  ORF type:complete len:369 (+),score=104.68 TRINITY_DN5306_c0_g1_i1:66-1172(+)
MRLHALTLLLSFVAGACGGWVGAGAPRVLSDVFAAGEHGYFCYKIPDVVRTADGTLLAFAEARRPNCSDYTWTDLVVKRSTDAGASWGALQVVHSNSTAEQTNVIGNAAPVVLATGRVLVPFNRNNRDPMLTYSDDGGATWAAAAAMANATRPEWGWIGFGPPAGLVLSSGRVYIPCYHAARHGGDGTFTQGHSVVSDDGGATWRVGGVFPFSLEFPNESQAVELAPGVVAVFSRGLFQRRLRTVSRDGGITFAAPEALASLPQPTDGCEGSTVKVTDHTSNTSYLVYAGLHDRNLLGFRYNMSLHASADEGKTWTAVAQIDAGPSGYSALVPLPETRSVGVLYERSNATRFVFVPDRISYVDVPLTL